jgi:hypothetical protein
MDPVFHLERVRLGRGGYVVIRKADRAYPGEAGRYFGVGDPVYALDFETPDGRYHYTFLRAKSFADAKRQAKEIVRQKSGGTRDARRSRSRPRSRTR